MDLVNFDHELLLKYAEENSLPIIVPVDNNEARRWICMLFDKNIDFLQFNKMILVINRKKLTIDLFSEIDRYT